MCVHCQWDLEAKEWEQKLQCATDKNVFPDKTISDAVNMYTKEQCEDKTEVTLLFYSECRCGSKHIFCAHNYYHGETIWYNWVMIKQECDAPEDVQGD